MVFMFSLQNFTSSSQLSRQAPWTLENKLLKSVIYGKEVERGG